MINHFKVYLIGAGPGDPELLTIKGKRLIEKADIIIYDNLVNPQLLEFAKEGCEIIYVGKKANLHTLPQDEINQLLVNKYQKNTTVVRLKGGDPIIFGRGGEEAEYLSKYNIPFEIIPGITSPIAAPIYAGIPITHRKHNSMFTVITGHEDPSKLESSINWKQVAKTPGTIIILMGVKNLPNIVNELINNGRNPDEPAALIQQGTTPFQKTVTSSLKDIGKTAVDNNIKPPTIFVIGDVINLRQTINWYENLPLFGKNIAITRAKDQSLPLKNLLQEQGANVIELPTIGITAIENFDLIDENINHLDQYNWIIFTSTNGIKHFFNRLYNNGLDARKLSHCKIAVIGIATLKELEKHGIKADLIPKKHLSSEIVEELKQLEEIKNKSFLLPRSDIAMDNIVKDIEKEGGIVTNTPVYKTILPKEEITFIKTAIQKESIDIITFTSPSTIENLISILSKEDIERLNNIPKASIGPITSKKILELNQNISIEALSHNIEGLVESIIKYFQEN